MKKRDKTEQIILHCSATKEGKNFKAKDIKAWHLAQKWSDIGYHYVIDLDGTIENGRDEDLVGAHCSGQNSNSIGICYIGGLDQKGMPKDTRTPEQKEAMFELVSKLLQKYNLPTHSIRVHNEYSSLKACPCFNGVKFRKEFFDWIRNNIKM